MNNPISTLFSPFQQVVDHFFYNPVTHWQRFFNPQFVLNYNDVGVENHVLSRVGSYGSQLSTLIDAVNVLREKLPDNVALDAQQTDALRAFDQLRTDSRRAVNEFRGGDGSASNVDVLALLQAIKRDRPEQFSELKKQVVAMSE